MSSILTMAIVSLFVISGLVGIAGTILCLYEYLEYLSDRRQPISRRKTIVWIIWTVVSWTIAVCIYCIYVV